jgi:hypothetical protein
MSKHKKVVMITDVDMSEDPDFVARIRRGHTRADIDLRGQSVKDDRRHKPSKGRGRRHSPLRSH